MLAPRTEQKSLWRDKLEQRDRNGTKLPLSPVYQVRSEYSIESNGKSRWEKASSAAKQFSSLLPCPGLWGFGGVAYRTGTARAAGKGRISEAGERPMDATWVDALWQSRPQVSDVRLRTRLFCWLADIILPDDAGGGRRVDFSIPVGRRTRSPRGGAMCSQLSNPSPALNGTEVILRAPAETLLRIWRGRSWNLACPKLRPCVSTRRMM